MPEHESENEGGLATITKPRVKEPTFYTVLIHNDDYTTMEFVVLVLKKFFYKSEQESTEITMMVHTQGKGVCGIFPKDVAQTKVAMVTEFSRKNGMPLKCTSEKA